MKYQIVINQAGIVDAGLHKKTDYTDWAILSHIYSWQASVNSVKLPDGKVWISYKNIIDELPVSGLTEKSAVSRRIKRIRELGLIETEQTEDKRLFIKTTALYEAISEHRQSVGVVAEQQGVVEEQQGGVVLNQHISDNYISSDNYIHKDKDIDRSAEQNNHSKNIEIPSRFEEFYSVYPKKRAKVKVEAIWKRKKLDKIADQLIQDVRRRLREDRRWLDGYIPDPTTYLNQERWNDEIERSGPKKGNGKFSIWDNLDSGEEDRSVVSVQDGSDLQTQVDGGHNLASAAGGHRT